MRIWLTLLTSFLDVVSRPPASANGIERMIDNITILGSDTCHYLEQLQPFPPDFTQDIHPIACHSHNDYFRPMPLLNAIQVGCSSIEADTWSPGRNSKTTNTSELYIGHSARSLTPERTLRQLYLDPLRYILDKINEDVQRPDSGSQATRRPVGIFDAEPNTTFVLLLDFKDPDPTQMVWKLLQEQLQHLRDMGYLTYWDRAVERRILGPITIVASGTTPFELVNSSETNPYHDVFLDAPLDKLQDSSFGSPAMYTPANSYYASLSLSKAVGKVWFGLTSAQSKTIMEQVERANQAGLLSRYWSTPSWPVNVRNKVWEQLLQCGVGVLNVDQLWTAGLRDWRLCWTVGWGICV